MLFVTQPGALEPGSWKLTLAISEVLPAKDSQLEHLSWRELRFEFRMKILAGRFSEIVDVALLHQVIDFDCNLASAHVRVED